jgi:beta-glucanase (GH16 family)
MRRVKWLRVAAIGMTLLAIAISLSLLLRFPVKHAAVTTRLAASVSSSPTATRQSTDAGLDLRLNSQASAVTPIATATPTHGTMPQGTTPTASTAPAPTSTPTTPGGTSGNTNQWTLIYSDNFSGTQLNSTWGTYNGPHAGGQSYYSPSEVQVSGGMLHISMEKKTTGGLPYTTGGLAAFRLTQVYGKYEFRVRLPRGKGVGPYAILWPNTPQPNTEQVDVFESPPPDKTTLYFTNHAIDGTSGQIQAQGRFADDFHTLDCEWTPGKLQFFVDGVSQGVITSGVPSQSMWFGLAISSGDAFTGLPDASTVLPVSMDVASVSIYKYNG